MVTAFIVFLDFMSKTFLLCNFKLDKKEPFTCKYIFGIRVGLCGMYIYATKPRTW